MAERLLHRPATSPRPLLRGFELPLSQVSRKGTDHGALGPGAAVHRPARRSSSSSSAPARWQYARQHAPHRLARLLQSHGPSGQGREAAPVLDRDRAFSPTARRDLTADRRAADGAAACGREQGRSRRSRHANAAGRRTSGGGRRARGGASGVLGKSGGRCALGRAGRVGARGGALRTPRLPGHRRRLPFRGGIHGAGPSRRAQNPRCDGGGPAPVQASCWGFCVLFHVLSDHQDTRAGCRSLLATLHRRGWGAHQAGGGRARAHGLERVPAPAQAGADPRRPLRPRQAPQAISVPERELRRVLTGDSGMHAILDVVRRGPEDGARVDPQGLPAGSDPRHDHRTSTSRRCASTSRSRRRSWSS